MQQCTICKETKPFDLFYKHKKYKTGYRTQCKVCTNEYHTNRYAELKAQGHKYIKSKKDSLRKNNLRTMFGISEEEYDIILKSQNHCCAVCKRHESSFNIKLHVDHAHEESKHVPKNAIRGLLCSDCNVRLISNHTDPEIFLSAAKYLTRHTGHITPGYVRKKKYSSWKKKVEK
ncbi:recombination endonuclease VII protein [Rhizobium phage RHph_N3_19]|nr:recombination endonuclease VII protein [Rhizobium phage RHph_N3_19]